MSVALALLAMLIELCLGYPQPLTAAIGHPVTWIGALIGELDRALNRDAAGAPTRRLAGGRGAPDRCRGRRPDLLSSSSANFSVCRSAYSSSRSAASTLLAQRSLHRHVAAVASALEAEDLDAGRNAVSHIVGRDTAVLDAPGVARAAIESLAENFSDAVVAPGAVAGDCRAPWRRSLQSDQHRRQYDRPPHRASCGVRLGGGAARRSGQSAGIAACGAAAYCGGGARQGRLFHSSVAYRLARRAAAPLAQCRVSRSGHGRSARPLACRPADLRRRARRRCASWAAAVGRQPLPTFATRSRFIARADAILIALLAVIGDVLHRASLRSESRSRWAARCAASASSVRSIEIVVSDVWCSGAKSRSARPRAGGRRQTGRGCKFRSLADPALPRPRANRQRAVQKAARSPAPRSHPYASRSRQTARHRQ